ncbi:hypothetical protein [Salinimicrobium terrae]|uniref:hypothetical protein n=1 Tax=Salinimicrobium terrae TaxID=470866 RepID=UPI000492079F|nr:hypothetical protein [Salinimicrobium terrae]
MGNEEVRDLTLRELLEDNFKNARRFRKLIGTLKDVSMKHYFQNIASRRSQFAIEISSEIVFYSGNRPYFSSKYEERSQEKNYQKNRIQCLKKALKLKKTSLLKYQEALCRIHDGSCREVLIRHKAYLENCIFELKALKSLLRNSEPIEGQADGISSYS